MTACVGVVEDDPGLRRVLCRMLESLEIEVHGYASAIEYLDDTSHRDGCIVLVLDVRMPGMSGLELFRQLHNVHEHRPPAVIFISGHVDVPMAVEAMRAGASDFLAKPFKEQQLLESVQRALRAEGEARAVDRIRDGVSTRLATLTPREREVLAGVVKGLRTKQIAMHLGIATKTAEEHRAKLMRKMDASNVAGLVTMCGVTR
jgi:FixJ family two-component response regulator